jgi:CheY-like chemotaxis protein
MSQAECDEEPADQHRAAAFLACASAVPSTDVTRERVLVVDDDDAMLRLVCPLLEAEDLDVDCVRNGVQALERLAASDYSVVLLDLRMPAGDGYSVIEQIERIDAGTRPLVLVISAWADEEVEREILSDIVTGVIRKPFDPTNLGAVVQRYVSRSERLKRREKKPG